MNNPLRIIIVLIAMGIFLFSESSASEVDYSELLCPLPCDADTVMPESLTGSAMAYSRLSLVRLVLIAGAGTFQEENDREVLLDMVRSTIKIVAVDSSWAEAKKKIDSILIPKTRKLMVAGDTTDAIVVAYNDASYYLGFPKTYFTRQEIQDYHRHDETTTDITMLLGRAPSIRHVTRPCCQGEAHPGKNEAQAHGELIDWLLKLLQ